ncbi:MAG: 1-deoxy-D-xylulose-5-phosphate synthase [Candidatus Omnitrophica bacterium]|nr:1-deoxy-D-xylulose-5-phosphate synthase [Candidatus Omnitrophota bacterium]HOX54713.1 1-deoxy-D-xylulose-5-phosphate synthase [Candidatus Omnitrophota bacterium]
MLEQIKNPSDLRKLPVEKLPALAQEIRTKIIEVVSKTGGHLASSLGAVELAIALHYCLNTPSDAIVWDVGHQAYAHKLLTGRYDRFNSLRQLNGISGFPSKEESEYDSFTTGHSSTAISLALGLAVGRDIKQNTNKIVAVIGDGSLTGGLSFEALNNTGHLGKDLLVIINTNEMSISPSVGALSNYLNKIISQPIYNRYKEAFEHFVKTRLPSVGSRMVKLAAKFEESLKGLIVPGIFFEELGFRYFGPLDGHNINLLIKTLHNILPLKGPRILHVITKKGKGYQPAEDSPVSFHSSAPFEIESGETKVSVQNKDLENYTEVFSKKVVELAKSDKKIVAITAAMPDGTGLYRFAEQFPDRFFDVGIAEEHALCFAAGLAKSGLKPVVAIYSTFLQRAFDQLVEEVSLQNLPIILAIDRAGIVGGDGVTHQGAFDIAYLKNLPNIVCMAPKDTVEFANMLEFAVSLGKPVAIRYPKESMKPNLDLPQTEISLGKAEILRKGKDAVIFALGTMAYPALAASEELAEDGLQIAVVNSRFATPVDTDLMSQLAKETKNFITIEEGVINGGFGESLSSQLLSSERKPTHRILNLGLPKEFVIHGSRTQLLARCGLDKDSLVKSIRNFLR